MGMGRGRKKGSKKSGRRSTSSSRKAGSGKSAGKAEEGRVRAIFEKVDADGSGKIDSKELGEALSNGTWEPFNEGTIALLMGMFDKSGDGAIGLTEWKSLWKYVGQWQEAFRRFDKDGSGAIRKTEMTTALTGFGYRLSPAFITFLVKRFDRSESAQLHFDDFVEACVILETVTATFKTRDTERCGTVTEYAYEDFLRDTIDLIFRLQAGAPSQDD